MTSRLRAWAVEQSNPAARSSAIRLTWTARVMTAHGSSAHLTERVRIARDLHDACATLDKKGGAHEDERAKIVTGPGH